MGGPGLEDDQVYRAQGGPRVVGGRAEDGMGSAFVGDTRPQEPASSRPVTRARPPLTRAGHHVPATPRPLTRAGRALGAGDAGGLSDHASADQRRVQLARVRIRRWTLGPAHLARHGHRGVGAATAAVRRTARRRAQARVLHCVRGRPAGGRRVRGLFLRGHPRRGRARGLRESRYRRELNRPQVLAPENAHSDALLFILFIFFSCLAHFGSRRLQL